MGNGDCPRHTADKRIDRSETHGVLDMCNRRIGLAVRYPYNATRVPRVTEVGIEGNGTFNQRDADFKITARI